MNRRNFLQLAALSGSQLLTVSPVQAEPTVPETSTKSAEYRERFELVEHSIPELQKAMGSGRESAVSLVKKYRKRIEAMNQRGPALRAVIELNPDALAIARSLDQERKLKGQ